MVKGKKRRRSGKKINGIKQKLIITAVISTIVIAFVCSKTSFPNRLIELIKAHAYGAKIPENYSTHGIDVSYYQGKINWNDVCFYATERTNRTSYNSALPRHEIDFVICKATEGCTIVDSTFKYNFYGAKKANKRCGAYHFFSTQTDAQKQAEHYIFNVRLRSGDFPPILDIEKQGKMSADEIRKATIKWLTAVENHYNVKPIIYTMESFRADILNTPEFDKYKFWIAHYNVSKPDNNRWAIWQHSDCGRIMGIKGNVDMNVINGNISDILIK